jgi:hypothetical protein
MSFYELILLIAGLGVGIAWGWLFRMAYDEWRAK